MALKLPRFLNSIPLVEANRTPSLAFHQWWDTTLKQIEKSVSDIQMALTAAGIALDNIGVLPPFSTRTVSTNTALISSDYLVLVDASSAGITISLPPVASKAGSQVVVKKIDSSVNTVTVDGDGSDTLDGAATQSLTNQYDSITVASDGTQWWIV